MDDVDGKYLVLGDDEADGLQVDENGAVPHHDVAGVGDGYLPCMTWRSSGALMQWTIESGALVGMEHAEGVPTRGSTTRMSRIGMLSSSASSCLSLVRCWILPSLSMIRQWRGPGGRLSCTALRALCRSLWSLLGLNEFCFMPFMRGDVPKSAQAPPPAAGQEPHVPARDPHRPPLKGLFRSRRASDS
jgi:hypothetical protein